MSKIELKVKINDRGLLPDEQEFIKLWLKLLELILEKRVSDFYINTMKETVDNLKKIRGGL